MTKGSYLGLDIAVATMSVYDADGFLGVQHDAWGEGKSGVTPSELHSPFGFYSRCLDPETDGKGNPTLGCQMLLGHEGGRTHAWLSNDPRVIPKLPLLKPGESLQYGAAGQFVRCHEDGSITLWTSDAGGDAAGQSVYFRVAKDAFHLFAPWGTMRYDASGLHVLSHSGARFDLGGIGGLPSPLDQLGSYASIAAAMFNVECSAASFGGVGAAPLARVPEIAELVTAISVFVDAASAAATNPGTYATAIVPINATFQAAAAALLLKMQSIVSGA